MAASTVWIRANDGTVSVNSITRPFKSCEYSESVGEADVTNLMSPRNANDLLCAEHLNDVIETTLRGVFVVDKANVNNVAVGVAYPCSFSVTGEQTHAGTIRLSKRGKPIAARGSFDISVEGKYTGLVSGQ